MSLALSFDTDSTISPPPEENAKGVGLSNPQLSQGRRRMLDLVNRLHNTGVQVDIDLPQIAVIGSQSAGKSSLIESISGITLPRAAGTCTRCPTECRLSRSEDPWKCSISLRFITDKNGQAYAPARNEAFGDTILDKAQVEERLRRAQRAILNPSTPARQFLTSDDEDTPSAELTFSTNYVSVQISGPDVADLSFCDLPGLIASVGKGGNDNDIKLVQSLVTSYISRPSCVILLTIACETDFENQGAHHLAKAHDPEGKRTIGVLTKPDRIPPGDEDSWIPFIKNEKEPLENNWYCVKQPSSTDLKQGITWTEARARENEFFSSTSPWSGMEPMYQKYLRTSNLVERLSTILSDLISKRLPEIQEELDISIQKTRDLLNLLPKEPSKDPLNDIANMLHSFTTDLSKHVEGIPESHGLIQGIRPHHELFRRELKKTAPDFRPYERRYASQRTLDPPKFLSNEEGLDDEVEEMRESLSLPLSPDHQQANTVIYIDEVMERAQQARTRELSGNFPYVVQETFIAQFRQKWNEPARRLCKSEFALVVSHVHQLIKDHFEYFGQGLLAQRMKVLIQEHLKERLEETERKIEWLTELEARPFTLNEHYFTDYRDKFLSYYKGSRETDLNGDLMPTLNAYKHPSPNPSYDSSPTPPTGIAKALAGLVEAGIVGVKATDLAKLLPPDRMEPALFIMADVRAYFQVAYKRFADNVPLAIDHELVRGLKENILKILYTGLRIHGPEGMSICEELAQESPQVAGRREEYLKKLERLNVANQELLNLA